MGEPAGSPSTRFEAVQAARVFTPRGARGVAVGAQTGRRGDAGPAVGLLARKDPAGRFQSAVTGPDHWNR